MLDSVDWDGEWEEDIKYILMYLPLRVTSITIALDMLRNTNDKGEVANA
jgi:hypothetical protein